MRGDGLRIPSGTGVVRMSFPDPYNPSDGVHLIAADRRRRTRVPSRPDRLTKVLLAGPDGPVGDGVVTCVVDYSMLGMGLIHPNEILPGQQFYLDTESTPGHLLTRRLLRSSRCTPMGGGRFLIGAEFIG
jgi:hypothetical protein